MPMLEMRPRPFHGMLTGTRDDGIISIGFVGSDCTLYSCPIWSIDELLAKPALLSPGVYVLLGDPVDQGGKLRAIVGEGGMLQERLQAHANDERLDYLWQILAVVGPKVMNETQRLMIQRRLTDEINHYGRAVVVNAHDADRFMRTELESVIADRIIEDIRPLICLVVPNVIAEVEPVRLTIGSRAHLLPRGSMSSRGLDRPRDAFQGSIWVRPDARPRNRPLSRLDDPGGNAIQGSLAEGATRAIAGDRSSATDAESTAASRRQLGTVRHRARSGQFRLRASVGVCASGLDSILQG